MPRQKKRAIALAGGGPAMGLSIGVLKALDKSESLGRGPTGNTFDVWTCACIGAWVAVVYNQADAGEEVETTRNFFRKICRPKHEYARFPVAAAFGPDWQSMMRDGIRFLLDPNSYTDLIVPQSIQRAADDVLRLASDPKHWNWANLNSAWLNDVLAVHPVSRFLTSLMYLSSINGLARVYYPHSDLLDSIDFPRLYDPGKPIIYYNSYNISDKKMELFSNRRYIEKKRKYDCGPITAETLCACSALPYIEIPVTIGQKTYVEGATVDTVNFKRLLENHDDIDEVWVCRIVDRKQIYDARNLYDALNNLIMLFASTTGEDDVKLFLYHAKEEHPEVKVFEIQVPYHINYDWTWENLDDGIQRGYDAALKAAERYPALPESPEEPPFMQSSAVLWPRYTHQKVKAVG